MKLDIVKIVEHKAIEAYKESLIKKVEERIAEREDSVSNNDGYYLAHNDGLYEAIKLIKG